MLNDTEIKIYQCIDPLQLFGDQIVFGLDYRLNALPRNERGELLFSPKEEGYYCVYLDWLADYLYRRDLQPNRQQKDLCRIVSDLEPEHAMRLLGTYAALYEFLLIDMETGMAISERIIDPAVYTDEDIDWIYREARAMWIADLEDDPESRWDGEVFSHPEYQQRPRENIIQYLREEAERAKLYPHQGYLFADVAWRVPLSVVLRKIPEKPERIRLLDHYFDFYDEYAHK